MTTNTNQLKAGAMLSYVSMGIGLIISLIYTPFMIRLLGQSEYGLYNLVASVVAYLGLLNFGLGSAYMRFYVRHVSEGDQIAVARLNGMYLCVLVAIAAVAALAGSALALNTEIVFGSKLSSGELGKAKTLMFILSATLALTFPGIVFSAHISANERFVFLRLLQIVTTVVSPFVTLPVLLLGLGSIGMAIVAAVVSLVGQLVSIWYCLTKLRMQFTFTGINTQQLREVYAFSFYVFIYMIIDQINWNVDKFVLGRLWGTEVVAVYAVGAQLNALFIGCGTALSGVFAPRIHRIIARSGGVGEANALFRRVGRVQFMLMLYLFLMFTTFGHPIILLLFGSKYSSSYSVALLLMAPALLAVIKNMGIEIRKAMNLHKAPALFMLVVTIFNVVISIPLARAYGAVGSALGTLIAMYINQVLIDVYYRRVVGIDMRLFWREIRSMVKALIAPILISAVTIALYGSISLLLYFLLVIPFSLSYLLMLRRNVLTTAEVQRMDSMLMRFVRVGRNVKRRQS